MAVSNCNNILFTGLSALNGRTLSTLTAIDGFTITAAPPGPDTISGLQLWLKADAITGKSDGDAMGNWLDQSGNSRDGTVVSTPLYKTNQINSLPAVQFSATKYFTLPNFLTAYTSGNGFSVVKLDTDPSEVGSGAFPLGSFGSAGDGYYCYSGNGNIYAEFGSTVRKDNIDPGAASLAAWHLYEERTASAAWSNYLDGTQLFTTGTNTVGWGTTPRIAFEVTAGKWLRGFVAEVFMYNKVLDAGEHTTIKNYISNKYALTIA